MIQHIIQIAQQAGKKILAIYEQDFQIEHKADDSPLTQADLAAHRHIVQVLRNSYPDIPILSEESAQIPYAERQAWSRYWLVDPLDGTKEFIKRNGEFTVNIALIEDGRPVLGVVHVPVKGWTYWGSSEGAYKQMVGQGIERIQTSSARPPWRIVGSRSHAGEALQHFLHRLDDYQLISMGSSLKLCLVAEGAADLYPRLGPTSEWDTAAAQAVVEAAGGQVVDLYGQSLLYNQKESLLNPYFLVYGDASIAWTDYFEAK